MASCTCKNTWSAKGFRNTFILILQSLLLTNLATAQAIAVGVSLSSVLSVLCAINFAQDNEQYRALTNNVNMLFTAKQCLC